MSTAKRTIWSNLGSYFSNEKSPGEAIAAGLSILLLALALLLSVFAFRLIFISRCTFEQLIREMDFGDLTGLTAITLSPYFAWALPVLAFVGGLKELFITNKQITIAMNIGHVLIVIGIREIYTESLFLPILDLMKRI